MFQSREAGGDLGAGGGRGMWNKAWVEMHFKRICSIPCHRFWESTKKALPSSSKKLKHSSRVRASAFLEVTAIADC